MDKGTMLTIADYCLERAKAAKEKQDRLFDKMESNNFESELDKIETSNNFYKESGKIDAFLELYNKLKEE